jgi:XapX domain-containing protein
VQIMTIYLLSLGAGILIGVMYALFKVRSPAPPGIALIGLLGMVLGEPLLPMLRHWFSG